MITAFLSKITEKESCLPKLVSEINSSGLPLLFYGAGKFAEKIYRAADVYSLNVSDVVVTSLDNNHADFMGHKLTTISDALTKYSRCNVFIAFSVGTLKDMLEVEKN